MDLSYEGLQASTSNWVLVMGLHAITDLELV